MQPIELQINNPFAEEVMNKVVKQVAAGSPDKTLHLRSRTRKQLLEIILQGAQLIFKVGTNYNALIEKHNLLVRQHNELIDMHKDLTQDFNTLVDEIQAQVDKQGAEESATEVKIVITNEEKEATNG